MTVGIRRRTDNYNGFAQREWPKRVAGVYERGGQDVIRARQADLTVDELGAVIFGCTNDTYSECIRKRLFGLPGSHLPYVSLIRRGLPLFLFNYTERRLYGIFEAVCDGALNIDSSAWNSNSEEETRFPAQARVFIHYPILFLEENAFKPAIIDNYYSTTRFSFELDVYQADALVELFKGPHARVEERRIMPLRSVGGMMRQRNPESRFKPIKFEPYGSDDDDNIGQNSRSRQREQYGSRRYQEDFRPRRVINKDSGYEFRRKREFS